MPVFELSPGRVVEEIDKVANDLQSGRIPRPARSDQQWETVQEEDKQRQGATQPLEPDSRTDEGHPRHHDSTIGRPASPRVSPVATRSS